MRSRLVSDSVYEGRPFIYTTAAMPGELDKICAMLEDGSAELQCAAALVLGELKPKDAVAKKALLKALKSPNEQVKVYALEALARIDPLQALPHLAPLLAGAEPLRRRVTQILVELGPKAAPVLKKQLDAAEDPAVRKGVLEVLGQLTEVDTTDALFAGLLDPDLEVVKKAAQAYRQRIEAMPPADRSTALKKILEFMESPRVRKAKSALAPCLLIVGSLRDPSAAKALLGYLDRKLPPAVRNHALLALGSLPLEGAAAQAVAAKLLPLLEEGDFNEIVKPALDVLFKVPPPRGQDARLFELLKSGAAPVKTYAIRAVGGQGSRKAAVALLDALYGDDPRVSDAAAGALRSNPDFVPALAQALARSEKPADAWRVAGLLRTFRNVLGKAEVRGFLSKGLALQAKEDERAPAYFDLVRAADPELLRDTLLKKGRELLARKKAEDAERHLRLLGRDDVATPESDLALAISRLLLQRLDVAAAGRDRGEALALFGKVARREGFPFVKSLEKHASLLGPRGLLYLGFALIERQGAERDAGASVLKLVGKKYGSREEGKVARQKLKTQGIG